MKALVILTVLLCTPLLSSAQKFKEWFRQKKTQKEYLIEQIAHLKLYLELTEKGYKIAKEGLTAIGDIKNGEFKLHKNYFDTLRIVNRRVLGYDKVKWITGLHAAVKLLSDNTAPNAAKTGFLTADEQAYVAAVFRRVLADCDQIALSAKDVTTSGELSMSDDERIRRIDELYEQMLLNYNFSKAFANEAAVLAAARWKEDEEVSSSRALHGIN